MCVGCRLQRVIVLVDEGLFFSCYACIHVCIPHLLQQPRSSLLLLALFLCPALLSSYPLNNDIANVSIKYLPSPPPIASPPSASRAARRSWSSFMLGIFCCFGGAILVLSVFGPLFVFESRLVREKKEKRPFEKNKNKVLQKQSPMMTVFATANIVLAPHIHLFCCRALVYAGLCSFNVYSKVSQVGVVAIDHQSTHVS